MIKKSILFLLVIILAILLCGCKKNNQDKEVDNQSSEIYQIEQETKENKTNTEKEQQNEESTENLCNVYFYSIDDFLLEKETVSYGEMIQTIPKAPYISNAYFDGWDQSLEIIEDHLDVHPKYLFVSNKENAIGFDSVYCKSEEKFEIEIGICGEVEFSSLELEITLNPNIKFESVLYNDDSSICNYSVQDNKLYIAIAFGKNMKGSIDICTIEFTALSGSNDYNPIKINVNEIAKIDEFNEIIDADYYVYNGNIFIYT